MMPKASHIQFASRFSCNPPLVPPIGAAMKCGHSARPQTTRRNRTANIADDGCLWIRNLPQTV